MTISSQTRKAGPYNGNGSTTTFPFAFKVFSANDVLVVRANASGVETVLTLGTDYTVSLNSNQDSNAGGNVVMATAPASGYTLTIGSQVPLLQQTDFTNQGGFYPKVLNASLDKLTIITQQLQEEVDRSAKLPISNTADANTLTAAILQVANDQANIDAVAGDLANIDAVAGNATNINTVAGNNANVTTVAGISSDVTAVAGNNTNITAVKNNATNINTVAGIAANVTTVAGIAANVTSVAGNATNINAVAGNATNIDAVAGNETNINAVNANKTNIDTVASINANVTTVAGISTDVETVSANNANVTTVATNIADVTTVATDIADINTCADNMSAILDAPAQASAAAASAAAAAASLDNFDDRYLGSKATAPTVDNDGNPLVAGALYFNNGTIVTDDKGMWVYDGGTWIAASAASQAILVKYKYLATAGQTTFTGTDANGLTLSYTAGSIIVTLNGVVMDAADYTATTGNSVVLGTAAALNDELGVFAFSTFDIANTYTQAQVDASLSAKQPLSSELTAIASSGNAMFKNRIINGAMVIDQRNAGASISTASTAFDVDRWKLQFSGGGVATVQQSSTVPSSTTFTNSVVLTVTTPDSSLAAGDYYGIAQYIEGYNVADLGFGTSAAAPVTLSFWVRSSVTGTYSVAFSNQDGATRTYVATYTINSANTWEQKTITVAGDTTGTWNKTNINGLRIWFALGMGSTYETANPNAWESSAAIQSTSSLDWIATNGATFYITGVQLEKGSTATSFDFRSYGTELALCQRYYENGTAYIGIQTGSEISDVIYYRATKRSNPDMAFSNKGGSNTNNPNFVFGGINQCGWWAPNNGWMSFDWTATAEL